MARRDTTTAFLLGREREGEVWRRTMVALVRSGIRGDRTTRSRVLWIRGAMLALVSAGGVLTVPHAGIALASPGANRCDLATATTVTPGPPGSPASFTLSGNNSAPGICSVSTDPCALDSDCPGEVCEGDCLSEFDRGYWEAFTLTADAMVTIHFCNTTPVRQGGDYTYLATTCEAGTGDCGEAAGADGVARADDCTLLASEICPEVLCGPGNNNLSFTINGLPGGATYYLPIHSANVCERNDPFNQVVIPCETSADCPIDRPCVSNRGLYDVRVLAEELPAAACCLPGDTCEERTILSCEGGGGTYLGPPNRFPAIDTCASNPCAKGSCCTGVEGCKDDRDAGGEPMTRFVCENIFTGSYVAGISCKGGTCNGEPDDGFSCSSPDDCADPENSSCDGTPEQLAQPNPCRLCTVDPASCHEPAGGSYFSSDLDRGSRTADDFVAGGSPITEVCWTGYYLDGNGADCGPGPGDAFTIAFHGDGGGYPGATISSQSVTPTRVESVLDGSFRAYEYFTTLTNPVTVTSGMKHWIEIVNDTTLPPADCNWSWKQSNGGNSYSVMTVTGEFEALDVYNGQGDADAAFCLDTTIGPDDDGAVLGACCTCPSSCVDSQTRAECNGVWHVGRTCAQISCSAPSVDDCAAAQPLLSASAPFHNTCANRDGPTTVPTDTGPATSVDRDVWYTYYAASTSPAVEFAACDISFDGVIAVYSNDTDTCSCPTDNTTLIAASDEGCLGLPYIAGGGTVTIPVTAGNCYLVRLAGFNGQDELGLGRINVSLLGVPPSVIFVNAAAQGLNNGLSWANAYTKLQDALAAPAAIGAEIWVAKGTYKPATCSPPCNGSSPERSATFQLRSGLGVYGGFAGGESSRDLCDPVNNETILSGDLNGDDGPGPFEDYTENSYHVVTSSETDATAILEGFTIRGGNADGSNPDNMGGGIYVGSGDPTIANCTIAQNTALGGGGIFIDGGSPTLRRCAIRENAAAFGGGVANDSGSPVVIYCSFVGNTATAFNGGGMDTFFGGSSKFLGCEFNGNTSATKAGGLYIDDTTAEVVNCRFLNNTANGTGTPGVPSGGGAMAIQANAIATITNSTIVGNSMTGTGPDDGGGGLLAITSSSVQLSNSILRLNTAATSSSLEDEQLHVDAAILTVDYSNIEGLSGGLGGTGNIGSDPLFVDPGSDDLRLQSGSPAIDAGDTTALPDDVYDLDGDGNPIERISLDLAGSPRILDDPNAAGTGVDMGAYEYFPDCNNNGVADGCELGCGAPDGPCDVPGCGLGADCDGNNEIDSCDIAACSGSPLCDDCNANDKPDLCDVPSSAGCPGGSCVSGCSIDLNQDCVPDSCVEPAASGSWDAVEWAGLDPGVYPGAKNAPPDLSVIIPDGTSIDLSVDVQVGSISVDEGAVLSLTDPDAGDLLVTGLGPQAAGITPPPKLRLFKLEGTMLLGNDRSVNVPTEAFAVNVGGVVMEEPAAGTTSAEITAAEVVVEGAACDAIQTGGEITLVDSMTLTSTGDLILDGSASVCPGGCAPFLRLGITPPPKLRLRDSVTAYAADSVTMVGAVDVIVDSTQAVELGGDFDNRSVAPHLFDWTAGKLRLNGSTGQVFEVAGINLGQSSQGFLTDIDALFDTCQHTNYSMGTVEVAPTANVIFVNRFANTAAAGCAEALYVRNLIFQGGATVTIDNCKVYYDTLTPNGVTPTLIGCGELLSTTRPTTPNPDPSGISKNRGLGLSVSPSSTAGPGALTALRVALVELQNPVPPNTVQYPPPDFSAYEFAATCTDPGGCARWIGEPKSFLESQDLPGIGSFQAARLQCTPYYRDWTTSGFFYVLGAEIVPSSKYRVEQFSQSCDGMESSCAGVSAPLLISTARYGDLASPYNPPDSSEQPNSLDVTRLVDKLKNVPGAPSKAIAQLQPNVPELNADVSALDIVACVDAVKQLAYAFTGPCPCPSLAACGALGCTLSSTCTDSALPGLGAGAMCVKTCTGGDNNGDPCINNTHCPGGTCGNGFCRDRCGRCH